MVSTLTKTTYGTVGTLIRGVVMTGTEAEVMTALSDNNVHAHQIVSMTLASTTLTVRYLKP